MGAKEISNQVAPYVSFNLARQKVKELGIFSRKDWNFALDYKLLPEDVPVYPDLTYKEEWQGWDKFFSSSIPVDPSDRYVSFSIARAFIRSFNFSSAKDWKQYSKSGKRPSEIPSNPDVKYRDEWQGFGDWISAPPIYKTFEDARSYAHSLELIAVQDWKKKVTDGLPEGVPAYPNTAYKDHWKGWNDFLNLGRRARPEEWMSFEDARDFARTLNLSSTIEWRKATKGGLVPETIPYSPEVVYLKHWQGWADFLGADHIKPRRHGFRPYAEAKDFISKLGLKSQREWNQYKDTEDFPQDIPKAPVLAYGDQWVSWQDFLGKENSESPRAMWREYEEARCFAKTLSLSNYNEWQAAFEEGRIPEDIPRFPNRTYSDWSGWSDFLGCPSQENTLGPAGSKWLPFDEARITVRELNLPNLRAWVELGDQSPLNIPRSAHRAYAKDWKGWSDFLGPQATVRRRGGYKSFTEAREYVRSLNLTSLAEWNKLSGSDKLPADIHKSPDRYYEAEWAGWLDWLGGTASEIKVKRLWMPFEEARAFIQAQGLDSFEKWRDFAKSDKRPKTIPSSPHEAYRDEWVSYSDWIGRADLVMNNYGQLVRPRKRRSLEEASELAKSLNISSKAEWKAFTESADFPRDIPKGPDRTYPDWVSWSDFLGVVIKQGPKKT